MAPKKQRSKGRKAGTLKKLADQMAVNEAEKALAEHPSTVSPHTGPVMVTIGGTEKEPVKADAATFAVVTPDDLRAAATALISWKSINVRLSMNLLSGKPLSRDIMNKDSDVWSERALRTDKRAFFGILDATVTGKLTRAKLVDAWQAETANRKRYDAPTLQALYKATMAYLRSNGTVEPRLSPMQKFARKCIDILNNRTLNTDERIRQIRAELEIAAGYAMKAEMPQRTGTQG